MRASGEVAEIGTDDLRFDASETARLFSETYGRELEPDVLADVTARTEGWAASLQLVQAALRDRSPAEIRRFVRSLTGADRELYDYLAEEVVGDLPDDLQQFLMRTSILQVVSSDLAAVVTGLDPADAARFTTAAERLTLLTRPSRTANGPTRYHPLVREFLEARLRSTVGAAATGLLHRRAAEAAASVDWRVAAYHYRKAGDPSAVATTIAAAIPEIMGSGQHIAAADEIDRIPRETRPTVLGLVTARMHLREREHQPAIDVSNEILESVAPGTQESDYALLNLMTAYLHAGFGNRSAVLAKRLQGTTTNDQLRLIAEGTGLIVGATSDGSVDASSTHLMLMAERQRGVHPHYFGVTMSNLAIIAICQDHPRLAVSRANEAIEALSETSSRVELAAALMARGHALSMLGLLADANEAIELATATDEVEADLERAELADSFLAPESAWRRLEALGDIGRSNYDAAIGFGIQAALYYARRGRDQEARAVLAEVPPNAGSAFPAESTVRRMTAAYVAVAAGERHGADLADAATKLAREQGATRWRRVAELLEAVAGSSNELSTAVLSVGESSPWNLTFVADLLGKRLEDLDEDALQSLHVAVKLHPSRWRFVLRGRIAEASAGDGLRAALLLETIGDRSDIERLRAYARRQRKLPGASNLGRRLARELADRAIVEDQGRVSIEVGERRVPGSVIRRKVLALLCFLLTRPDMSSTRDQVLDALWPDLDPLDALNSLNQTVYFLRRVLEERYVDDLSPGYLHHDSDLIWLDTDLVSSRSNDCRRLIKSLPPTPAPDQVDALVEAYHGRFALDFEYEEWAAPYRDWLHASYLEIVERALSDDIETGHFDRGISLARRVLDIDPTAEHVEVSLLRLYRASGAHAAAAEQYSHYASAIREQLGVEPPPLDSL
jgi:DNA-binding SARP family transcriptional activator